MDRKSQTQLQISELNDLKSRMLLRVSQKSFMVFGPRNVGKSTLISRFLIDHVFEEKRDFMNEGIRKLMIYKNNSFEIEVLDTSSYDPYFTFLPTRHGVGVSGYIIMYDPMSLDSVSIVQNINDKLFQINGRNKPVVLLGNVNLKMRVNHAQDGSFLVPDDEVRVYALNHRLPWLQLDIKHCSQRDICIIFFIQQGQIFNKLIIEVFREEFKSKPVPLIQEAFIIVLFIVLSIQLIFGILLIGYAAWLTWSSPQSLYKFEGALILFILLCVGLLYIVSAILAYQSVKIKSRDMFCAFQLMIFVCFLLAGGGLVVSIKPEQELFQTKVQNEESHVQIQLQSVMISSMALSIIQFFYAVFVGMKIKRHRKQ